MANKNAAKRALTMSVISMLICIVMLMGTTFAWFTDSVVSGKNTIVAGNLDVELEYSKDLVSWKSVEGMTDLFDVNALWEPGHTEVIYLRVSNLGTLALQYQFSTTFENTVIGKNVLGNDIELSDYLEYGIKEGVTAKYATREAARADVTGVPLDAYTMPGKLEANQTSAPIAYVVYMPETVGNEANYVTGTDAPVVELGVNLVATQVPHEKDSFGIDYDDITLVTTEAELRNAFAKGGDIMLASDVKVDADNTITVSEDTVLDLNGKSITGVSATTGKNRVLFTVKGNMTVTGEGTVSMSHTGANMGWNNLVSPFSVESGELTLEEGVSVVNLGGTDMAYAVDVNTTLGESVLNVNGADLYSSYIAVRIFNNHSTEKGIVNYNGGNINGAKKGYDIWAQLMNDPAENAVVNFADGISYTTINNSGTIYLVESETALVGTADSLTEAIKNGGEVVFVSDITVDKWIMFSETLSISNGNIITVDKIDVTIDGNGHTLTVNSIESAGNGNRLFYDASKLNISDLTIKYAEGYTAGGISLTSGVISNVNFVNGGVAVYPGNGDITIENCTFNTNGTSIYFEQERDNLTVTGCTFNQPDGKNVILLRGDVKFTNNTVNSGRTVNIVSGSPVVTGNNFNNVRLKVYSAATATVSNNTINNLQFETTTYASDFADNTLSADAQAALNAVSKI